MLPLATVSRSTACIAAACMLLAAAAELKAADGHADPAVSGQTSATVDTTRWRCRLCAYPEGWHGMLEFGPGWVSDPSLKFGAYRGLEDRGWFPSIAGDVHYRGSHSRYLDITAHELGLDSRRIEARGGEQGRYAVRLGWHELPFYRGHDTQTPFVGTGSGRLTLPNGWRPGNTTPNLPDLPSSLAPATLGLKRQLLTAGLTLRFGGRWSWDADYHHEDKNGTRPFGAGVFTINAAHFPAPVDFTTDRFDMGLSASGRRGHVRLGFTGSKFSNGTSSVTWQNPFSPVSGTETLQAALEPDNEHYRFSLVGSFAPGRRLRFSGRATWGRMHQNDTFLPRYSLNPEFSDLRLPRPSLSGEVNRRSLYAAGRVTLQLGDRLDAVASLRLDQRDNDTPVDIWTPVITDLVPREPGPNLPYGFERDRYRLEFRHRTNAWLRLAGGAEHERVARTLQEARTTREQTWWGEVSLDRWSRMSLRVRLEGAYRNPSDYRQLANGGLTEHPLQRKFHLADRDRERAVLEVDLVPADRLGISLSWHRSEDEYTESAIGLRRSSDSNLTLDLSYAVDDALTLYAFATREVVQSTISGAATADAVPWHGDTDDRFVTFGGGGSYRISERLSAGLDYVDADSEGRIRVDTGAGEPAFPDLATRLRSARLRVDYRFGTRWSGTLQAEYERYDSADWYVDGLGAASIPAILTMGADSPDYRVVVLRLLASCRF